MLTEDHRNQIDAYLIRRGEDFAARQQLIIRDEVESNFESARAARRDNLLFVLGAVGISGLAIASFLYSEITQSAEAAARSVAKEAAEAQVAGAVAAVERTEAELNSAQDELADALAKLEAATDEIDALKSKILNTEAAVRAAESQVLQIKEEALELVGQVNAMKGGIMVLDGVSSLLEDFAELRLQVERNEMSRRSDGPPDPRDPEDSSDLSSGTVDQLFPGAD